jgi:hypothetical protein
MSRLDFLQGTCEKIHFQDLLGQHPLQATHLVPQGRFPRGRWGAFVALQRLKLLAPRITTAAD